MKVINKAVSSILLFLGVLVVEPILCAATVNWDGEADDGVFHNATNWAGDIAPSIFGVGDDFAVVDSANVTSSNHVKIANASGIVGGLTLVNGSSVSGIGELVVGTNNFSGNSTGSTGTISIGTNCTLSINNMWFSIEPGNTFRIDFTGDGGSFSCGSGGGFLRVWNTGWAWSESSWEDLWNRGVLTRDGEQTGAFTENFNLSADGKTITALDLTPVLGVEVAQAGTKLSWSVENEIDIKEYRVMDAATDEIIENITAGSDSYSVILPEGITAKLIVVDKSGYIQSFYPVNNSFEVVEYVLEKGWNLISIVGENTDTSAIESELWGWNGSAYEIVVDPKPTQAVWVYSNNAVGFTVRTNRSDAEIELVKGWNMVGPVNNCTVPKDAYMVYGWNQTYEAISDEQGTLVRGVGYWIYAL